MVPPLLSLTPFFFFILHTKAPGSVSPGMSMESERDNIRPGVTCASWYSEESLALITHHRSAVIGRKRKIIAAMS